MVLRICAALSRLTLIAKTCSLHAITLRISPSLSMEISWMLLMFLLVAMGPPYLQDHAVWQAKPPFGVLNLPTKRKPQDPKILGKEFLFCFSFLIKENLVSRFPGFDTRSSVNPESSVKLCAPSCSLDTASECPREDLNSPLLPFWLEVFPLPVKKKPSHPARTDEEGSSFFC